MIGSSWIDSDLSGISWDSILEYNTTTSIYIILNSPFIIFLSNKVAYSTQLGKKKHTNKK
jgi:hypothetical protein